jgi:hypothetical protein
MANTAGIHTIVVRPGVDRQQFEDFMTSEAFPRAAEVPGSINRKGRSVIESQHLLKGEEGATEYLWLVKSSGVLDFDQFSKVFKRMFEEVRDMLERLGTHKSAFLLSVTSSFDAGPRDELGRLTGPPIRGRDI